ncbi:MAG: YwaF family protein [Firmicutes bacterium]|nr:YwaF family protein [Bacillota bacterium]
MSEFWYTVYTMQDTYGSGYQSFSLFDSTHIFWLVFAFAVCATGALLYRKASPDTRRRVNIILAAVIVCVEASRQLVIIVTGQWRPETLPLHMCSINIFVCLWYAIKPNKLAANILYSLCMPGAAVALLSPSWLALPINNFCHINSEVLHILLLMYPILLLAGGFRPDIHELPKVLVCLFGFCAIIYPLNKLIGTNFMFLNGAHSNAITSLCASVFGDELYLIGFAVILAVILTVLYLPFVLTSKKHAKEKA